MKLLACTLALVVFANLGQGRDFFVAPGGSDTNSGTGVLPFATIQHAINAARTEAATPSKRIVLCQGEYFGVTLELLPADSGLTICAAAGEGPILYGGQVVTNFQPDVGQFVSADLPPNLDAPDFRMLQVNGHWAPRARYPETNRLTHLTEFNVAWMGTYGGGWQRKPTALELTSLKVRPTDVGSHFEPANAELTIFHQWDESLVRVKTYDPATGKMTFTTQTGHPPGAFGRRTYVIWNTRDGMSRPGQWYLDRVCHKIVYWPLTGEKIQGLRAVFPTTTAIIRLTGSSNEPIRNITIEGLTLAVANTPMKTGGYGGYAFDGAITAEHIVNCRFIGNTIRHAAGQAIKLSAAQHCAISENELYEMGTGGVLCDGQDLEVTANHIHHLGLIYPSGIGATCTGSSNRVTRNFIHDTPYVGLTCDGLAARIEYNRLERVMQELQDGAAIYLGGTNHLIRYNYCREIGGADGRHAYYMDEMVRDSRLEHNLAVACPSPLHNHLASNNIILHNFFINDGDIRLAFYRCETHRVEKNVVVAKGRIEIFRPEAVTAWSNNFFYSQAGVVMGHPVKQYTPDPPAPFRVAGVQLDIDPQISESQGLLNWPNSSRLLGIQGLDLRSCGQKAGPIIRKRQAQTAATFEWAKAPVPTPLLPFVTKQGFRDAWRNQPGPLGGVTEGIDLWQANNFIVYRKETADFLYKQYTPLVVNYRPNTLPQIEPLAARYTAGLTSNREKALALLTRALPDTLRHPSIPPCSRGIPPNRALSDEDLLYSGAAWCNEQARVFVRLCQASGIPARIVFLFYSEYPRGHVVSEFYVDGHWAMADSSWICVFPDEQGRLLSAAEIHTTPEGRICADAAYRKRLTELLKLKDDELNRINGAGVRRFLLSELEKPAQLDTFGLLNYPLPTSK